MPAIDQTEDAPQSFFDAPRRDYPLADTLSIPSHRIVSVEHPCIIRNLENGLKSMGGEPRMKHLLEHHVGDSLENPLKPKPEPELGITLRPEDPLAYKLTSTGVDTRNVLMKVTVPKRTGRKRKRGSTDPFEQLGSKDSPTSITAPELLKRLRDNEHKFKIEPISMVHETHRFRGLPDIQTKAGDVPIFREFTDHILQPSWKKLKDFALDTTPGLPTMPAFPGPPTFAASAQPYRYEYQQAAGVRFSKDAAGNVLSKNMQAPIRKIVKPVPPDVDVVPQHKPKGIKQNNPHGKFVPLIVKELEALLKDRPLLTRRVVINHITPCSDTVFREATQWVGYNFSAGPFRDCLIKYGVDPRKDPQYRIYQTLMFQVDKRVARANGEKKEIWSRGTRISNNPSESARNSHLFDGENISADGKTWQVCDVTDPLIKKIFETQDLPQECDVHSYGWFYDGTMCKARIIMREKMDKLFEESPIPHEVYALVATLPEHVEEFTFEKALAFFGDAPFAREAASLAAEARNMARAGHKAYLQSRYGADKKDTDQPDDDVPMEEPIQGDLEEAT